MEPHSTMFLLFTFPSEDLLFTLGARDMPFKGSQWQLTEFIQNIRACCNKQKCFEAALHSGLLRPILLLPKVLLNEKSSTANSIC